MRDLTFETVLSGIEHRADRENVELIIEDIFTEDEDPGKSRAVIIQNMESNCIGLMAANLKEYPDEHIVFLEFNSKLYEYCKTEGFTREQMLSSFDKKVLKLRTLPEFTDFLLDASRSK